MLPDVKGSQKKRGAVNKLLPLHHGAAGTDPAGLGPFSNRVPFDHE